MSEKPLSTNGKLTMVLSIRNFTGTDEDYTKFVKALGLHAIGLAGQVLQQNAVFAPRGVKSARRKLKYT